MNDFEIVDSGNSEQPAENSTPKHEEIELPSGVDNTATKSNDNTDATRTSNQTFGAVYTPSEVRGRSNSYSYTAYTIDPKERTDENSARKKSTARTSHGTGKKWPIITAIIIAASLIFTGCSIVGASLLANLIYGASGDSTTTTGIAHTGSVGSVYVDGSENLSENTVVVAPGEEMELEQAVALVKDSVVEITTETVTNGFGGFSQYVVSGAGSGVIISDGGYVITNHHVIEGARAITVRLSDGTEYDAHLVATDSKTDIAVISFDPGPKELSPAIIGNSDSLVLAEDVFAIGNPLGELGGTVTDGIISCLERQVHIDGSGTMNLMQTNVAVNPGNSGGGLFDMAGRLVGIVNAKFSGDGIEGISFAIPMNTAYDVANQLIEKGYVSGRPDLGVKITEQVYGYGVTGERYYAVFVTEDYPEIGLKNGDRIISVGGNEISSIDDISYILSNKNIGDTVELVVIRSKRYYTVELTLVEYTPQ